MSFQVTTAFTQAYADNIEQLSQQQGSRLRNSVRAETGIVGTDKFFDQLGSTVSQAKTSRHADTPLIETPHARRKVSLTDYEWADLVDDMDKLKMLPDPTDPYAVAGAWAQGRTMDDLLLAAALGSANTGVTGATAVTLPSSQKIVNASTNLTLAKLITAKGLFGVNDVDVDNPMNKLYMAVSQSQLDALLTEVKVQSVDYNTIKALVEGTVRFFMGFEFIRTQRVAVASSIRSCVAWAKSGLLLGIGKDITGRLDQRVDKSMAWQPYNCMSLGATRMEEVKVVQVDCLES